MPSKTGKPISESYKNDLAMNQTSNVGVDSTTRNVQDGAGNNTSISLSDDVLSVQPVNDNTTGTMLVKNNAGNNILAVDTTNSKVLAGASQVAVNTQYAYFGTDSLSATSYVADTHYAIPFAGNQTASTLHAMGSSTSSSFNDTDPATSLTISADVNFYIMQYWWTIDNITIDAVHWWNAADAATGDDLAAHLMVYDVVSDNSSTSGDLSSGVVVADGATITNAGYEQAYYQSMTIQSANVDAGQVVLFTFASDTVNSDYHISAVVKYHTR